MNEDLSGRCDHCHFSQAFCMNRTRGHVLYIVHTYTHRLTSIFNFIKLCIFIDISWRRQWHPTPVFLPGESQGQGNLVGCHLWGHTELDTTEAT